jgi:hypothetical protein
MWRRTFGPRDTRPIMITDESSNKTQTDVSARHPLLAYVFGDMVRAFFIVGCLVVDLFAPLQVHESLPALDLWLLPPLFAGLAVLSYAEYRAYRWLWPGPGRREIVDLVERRSP